MYILFLFVYLNNICSVCGMDLLSRFVSCCLQPPLNQSTASSLSMPQPLTTQDFHRANPGEFSSIGLRPHPDSFSASLPVGGTTEGRPGTHHTFTHHLYHHYNAQTAHGTHTVYGSLLFCFLLGDTCCVLTFVLFVWYSVLLIKYK